MRRSSAAVDLSGVEAVADIEASDLLRRVGEELSRAALTLKGLQSSIGPALIEPATMRPELVRDLQSLDHVEQVLRNLSGLIGEWTTSHPGLLGALVDRLSLAELAARLRGAEAEAAVAGDFDLF